MKASVFTQEGKELGQTLLPKEVFNLELNQDLVHQVAVSQMANRRQIPAHTKDRGEVRGGGRKPWRQKGLGRARHGSRRSPIWIGGGVTFGPRKEKVFKKAIPGKMRKKALLMVLSAKARNSLLVIVDSFKLEEPKTKAMESVLLKLPSKRESSLIVLPGLDKKIVLACRNLPKVKTIEARNLNVLDLLNFKYAVMPRESLKIIKETFLK